MDTKKLIYETINFGNPFEAIEQNFFSYQELTDYLASNSEEISKDRLYLTFTALLRLYPPEYLYSMGKHLLCYFPNDAFIHNIYVVLGGSPELPLSKDEPNQTLWSLIFDVYSDFVNDVYSDLNEKAMLLCNKITLKLSKNDLLYKDENFIKMLYEYRCDKVISMLKKCGVQLKTILFAIDADWFEMYPSLKRYYQKYIEHVDSLRINAPLYFSKMLESYLNQLCTLTLRDFEKIDFNLLKKTCLCFPQQFTDVDVDEKYQRICVYPLSVRAYVLGLSCLPRLPSKKLIDDALLELSKVGMDEYTKNILNSQTTEQIPNSDLIANSEDTLYEKPSEYLSLDRINIEENGKIYQFTRPEFKKLYTDKRNFWTKQPLTYSDLYSIQLRIQICQTLILPSSDTYKIILEKACKGNLYEEPITPESNTTTSQQGNIQQYQNYLASMFHALLNQGSLQPDITLE